MTTHDVLSLLRNPWGHQEYVLRDAQREAADIIERQAAQIAALRDALDHACAIHTPGACDGPMHHQVSMMMRKAKAAMSGSP